MTTSQPTMQAIEITRFGTPDVLAVVQRPMPVPAAGEVLVEPGPLTLQKTAVAS